MRTLKVVSYNVNGIRAAIKKGLLDWLSVYEPDVVCLQETKISLDQIDPSWFLDLGYQTHWACADKRGYSGVAILSKLGGSSAPQPVGHDTLDHEGRLLTLDLGEAIVVSAYFPSGTTGDARQSLKYEWLDAFHQWAKEQKKPLIIAGDYNIAHTEIDIHNPVSNKKSSGFLPEERQWLSDWFSSGFVDSFRYFHPAKRDEYSWWTYRVNARANNKGWRIDYISVDQRLAEQMLDAGILQDVNHSDHCPIYLKIKI